MPKESFTIDHLQGEEKSGSRISHTMEGDQEDPQRFVILIPMGSGEESRPFSTIEIFRSAQDDNKKDFLD